MKERLSLNLKIQNKILGLNKYKCFLFTALYFCTNFSLLYIKNSLKHLKLSNSFPYQILDAGCGRGFLSSFIAGKFPNATILAVDDDNDKIEFVKNNFASKYTNIKTSKESLLNMQEPNKFNLIFLIDVLEHISEDTILLKRLYDALSNKGRIVIHTTSDIFKGVFFDKYFSEHSFPEHVRPGYKKENLLNILKTIGFNAAYFRCTFGFFGTIAFEFFFLSLGECFWLRYKTVNNNIRTIISLLLSPFFTLVYPFIFLFFVIDVQRENSWGNGILIIAEKNTGFEAPEN